MAAKAKAKPSKDGKIWFNDAVRLLADRCGGDAGFAERLLVDGLKADRVPWTRMRDDGVRVTGTPGRTNTAT